MATFPDEATEHDLLERCDLRRTIHSVKKTREVIHVLVQR